MSAASDSVEPRRPGSGDRSVRRAPVPQQVRRKKDRASIRTETADEKRAWSDAAITSSAESVEPAPGHPVRRILIIVGLRDLRRRVREPRRLGHPRLVQRSLGHAEEHLRRVHHRGRHRDDRADNGDGVRMVLDPPLRVPWRGALDAGVRRVRRLRRDEQHPACEPRHDRDVRDAHDGDRVGDVRRHARRLHGARRSSSCSRARSSTSTSSSPFPARSTSTSHGSRSTRGRSRSSSSPGIVVIVADGAAASGRRSSTWWEEAKEGGRILAHPGAYFGRVFLPEFVALGRGPLRRRDLPRRLRDPRHIPLGHDRGRQQLDLQHRLGDAGRGRRQPGVQRRRPERRHQLADGDRLLGRAATRRRRRGRS